VSTGPEMLLIAGLKAFVPKETAEKINAALTGMLNDGTLDGIGSLVSDIAEIKRAQSRIEFALGRIFAELQSGSIRADTIERNPAVGLAPLALAERGASGSGGGYSGSSGEPDNGSGPEREAAE
jgi:hypothetical protein